MRIDRDLFMYDLVVVTIVRDEAPYIKEWIDYHLLAGVNHFLIYDNESSDNLKEILQPYIDKKLVTRIDYPQVNRQLEAYNDAVNYFKFFCRRMVFLDVDEFIFPQDGKTIPEIADEILGDDNAGLAINFHVFGSSGLENADYDVGILERFTHRANDDWKPLVDEIPSGNAAIKTIADPRRIKFFSDNPHIPEFWDDNFAVNEELKKVTENFSAPVSANKIVINYYATKSREEYLNKIHRRKTSRFAAKNELADFEGNDQNSVVDEEILSYREKLRAEQIPDGGNDLKILSNRNRANHGRMLNALVRNLTPDFSKGNLKIFFDNPKNRTKYFNDLVKLYKKAPPIFFDGKLETFLTCLLVSTYLKKSYLGDVTGALFEEASLNAICQTFTTNLSIVDLRLLIAELPRLLSMPYATVNAIIEVCLNIFSSFLHDFRTNGDMKNFEELNYIVKMLHAFARYRK